jgi:archaellum component FlaC
MPPKKDKVTNPEPEDFTALMDMMRSMSTQMNSMNSKIESMDAKMNKIESIETEVKTLKVLLSDLTSENKKLKQEAVVTERKLADMNERNNQLENRLNSLEQHHRGWSARVLNIPLTPEEEADNSRVASIVYNLVLLPILQGAQERKLLMHIPPVEQLLEMAHVLPGKVGETKPIIMRFFNRNTKDLIFRLKKFYAPRISGTRGVGGRSGGGGGGSGGGGEEEPGGFEGRGKYAYPLYEDLTRAAFKKMRAIADDERVKACWSVKGQLKFVLHKSPNDIKKVVSLLDPLDTILK